MSNQDKPESPLAKKDFDDFSEGDILCVTYRRTVGMNQVNIVYRESLNNDEFLFYPLSLEGYRQAQYEDGTTPSGFYKIDDYKMSYAVLSAVFEVEVSHLTGAEKTYADLILAII